MCHRYICVAVQSCAHVVAFLIVLSSIVYLCPSIWAYVPCVIFLVIFCIYSVVPVVMSYGNI